MPRIDYAAIERKWQQRWATEQPWRARGDGTRPKYYALVEFPYPSGEGLHVGHLRSYTAMDIIARKRRMEGFDVLYPIGWDAFGLPAENYALKTGQHPRVTTEKNCANFRRQLQSMGFSFDWSREVDTTDPAYYRWTQWIFLKLLDAGLAYKATVPINWCPSCRIGLANEEAIGGVCERCGGSVEKRDKEQWMLKITAYAEKLLAGLETVDYIERAKVQQVNWIGRSEGAEIGFQISNFKFQIPVFTTRPDTLFGATYLVLAPEHAAISNLKSQISNWSEVEAYIAQAKRRTDIERTAEESAKGGSAFGGKTGVELKGIRAVNPANGEEIPVWIADYVLGHYGTGAIMAVPAHDDRDSAFAQKYGLPIVTVIARSPAGDAAIPSDTQDVYVGEGALVNSGKFNGMASEDAKRAITEHVGGKMTVTYKLRDWVFSRQRYWGEPIPVVFCAACAKNAQGISNFKFQIAQVDGVDCAVVPVPEDQLPVELPNVEKYQPTDTGESPLAAISEWANTKCPQCGGPAKRETDVMPNWAGSSWYFLRYCDPQNDRQLADPEKLKHWIPVDWYNGGMEHTTLHLLYSRFWSIFLHDIGVVPVAEPYQKRTSHGLILAADGEKMSKSRGNVVNPDDIVREFSADAVRVYEMFIGPFDQPVPWSTDGLVGCRRFLEKVVTLTERVDTQQQGSRAAGQQGIGDAELDHLLHKTIKKVTEDIEAMRFNTAVSAFMEFTNALGKKKTVPGTVFETLLTLLAPFAPHLAEELWERLRSQVSGLRSQVSDQSWPTYDPALVVEEEIDLIVQVNGKVRATIRVPAEITEHDARARALAEPNVQKYVEGRDPKRVVFIPGKLISIVV